MRDFKRYSHIIGYIDIGTGVIARVPRWIIGQGYGSVLVVADENSYGAAGSRVCQALSWAGVDFNVFVFGDNKLVADEEAVRRLADACGGQKLILGVGSGTINDLCKLAAHRAGLPCAIVATAPSMDGYASRGAAVMIRGMKTTPQTQCPAAIFCDVDVLSKAPAEMISAGVGDMVGKYSSLMDWRLSTLLTGEEKSGSLYSMMEDALNLAVKNAAEAARRDPAAIIALTESLLLSGLAMTIYGDSRPASGAEHHLAHFWEMRILAEGGEPASHGHMVGVAALCALRLWKLLPDRPYQLQSESREDILKKVTKAYGPAAIGLLPVPNPELPFHEIEERWDDILAIARTGPGPRVAAKAIEAVGGPLTLRSIGVGDGLLRESVLLARERKKSYTILQLLGGLGLLERFGALLSSESSIYT